MTHTATTRPCRQTAGTDLQWGPLSHVASEFRPGTLRLTTTLADGEVYNIIEATGARRVHLIYRVGREMGFGAADLRAALAV